ncbi:MAG: transposase [Gammaproteobacteria bacterium]|nr:MAG: transposase [Gammaproteobacteria bacterium]
MGPLLRAQGYEVSDSTVGRILRWLKARGRLPDVPVHGRGRRHGRPWRRPWAQRAPYGLKGRQPGELVQVDVLHVHLLPGVTVYHFTAWDGASRWSVGQVYSRVSSRCAADFLDQLQARCPFPIRSIQIDGGSEFMGEFEQACQKAGIALYVLPPKRPQRNGGVEQAHGIWRYEFYASYPLPTTIRELRPLLQWWEQVYNLLRPHQALKQRTPAEYLREVGYEVPDVSVSHMY